MNDFKSSQVSIDDDMLFNTTTVDDIMPSYHYRFYIGYRFIYIAFCRDKLYRVLSNYYPQKVSFSYNSKPVNPCRWHRFWCLNLTADFFQAKRCFLTYCTDLINEMKDAMFAFQPVLGDM